MSASSTVNRLMGSAAQQRAESDLKTVLTNRGGQVSLQDLRSVWEEVHGSALSLPNYGVFNVMALLDRCRSVCRLEKHGRQDVIKLNYSQTAVSNFVASVQLDLHRTGRAVSFATVINRVCEQLGVDKYSEFGLGPPRQLPRLLRLSELEKRLETYVTTYAANRMIATLYDLQSYICHDEKVSDFESLQIGPLVQMPLVRSLFQIPVGQTEIMKVAVVDVVEALSSLMRQSNRMERIKSSDIVDKMAVQHGVPALALGVRIKGLGFYIKNLGEARKKEHEAQDLLNRKKQDMHEAAMKALKADKESLEQQQALKLTALQQQHAAELQALQVLGTERRARFQNELEMTDEIKPEQQTCSLPAAHEHRKTGFTTTPGKTKDAQSWLMLSVAVKQMDDRTLKSLSAFSLAIAQQCYAAANINTKSRAGHSLGQIERLDFWKSDVLAGLLMQAFMLATFGFGSSTQMLQTLSFTAAGIKLNCEELPQGFMYVPGMSKASPGTEWMCMFWNFLRITVDWKSTDPPEDEQDVAAAAPLADLKAKLCATFAAGQSKAFGNKQERFWLQDCLAAVLFEALMDYVSSGQAVLDGDAMQEWLCSHSKNSPQAQAAGTTASITQAEGEDIDGPFPRAAEPIDASTLHAAISKLSSGFSLVDLARLEDQLVRHFQVPTFASLGHGASLVQLLFTDSVALECMSGSLQGSAVAPLDQVLEVLNQAVQCTSGGVSDAHFSDSQLVCLQQALCSHFRVSHAGDLGHGSMQRLMKLHAARPVASSSSSIASLAALACTDVTPAGRDNGMDVLKAMQQLQSAPQLADLQEWTQWAVACEPTLGRLSSFLSQHGTEAKVAAVELPGGALIKVDPRATPTEFLQAASACNGQAAAAALIGQVVAAGGPPKAPLVLLASYAEAALHTLQGQSTVTSMEQAWSEPAAFVLEAMSHVPAVLRRSLAKQVFLQPFYKAVGNSSKAEAAILAACKDDVSAQTLYSLGIQLGISSWQQHWLQRCEHSVSLKTAASEPLDNTAVDSQDLALPAEHADATPTHEVDSATACVGLESVLQSMRSLTGAPQQGADGTLVAQSSTAAVSHTLDARDQEQIAAASEESFECQKFIENIRQTEFGMGVELDASGAELRQKMNDRLGRALHRLSQDLYSKDVHFVLELVQNADDNAYEADVWPAVEFILKDTGITIVNNEVGFTNVNVKALCDVGKSTKQHKVGYIGQKGIGFKSVFKVTDAAEIHSKGFHISFDLVQHQALGYILPTWIEDTAQHAPEAPRITSLQLAATRVVLPYKQDVQSGADQLLHHFDDIQPTLLLFLQKLQCIAITDTTPHHRDSVMLRKQLPNGVVELRHGAQAQHATKWLMVRQTVQPHSKRLDVVVEDTELAMAFELCKEAPSPQQVFAFLPLRRYGLRFIIQANFIVPSSREAVDSNSAWNEELRGHLPELFCKALASFKALPAQDGLLWVNRWLLCIPLQGEAEDFFAPLPQAITSRLRQAPCIATEDHDWVLPAEAVVCTHASVAARKLLAHATSSGVAGAKYVHPDLTVLHKSSALQSALGIRTLDVDHLLQVLNSAHAQSMLPDLGMQWCAHMLACIFDMLTAKEPQLRSLRIQDMSHSASVQSVCQQLRSLPVFPLSSGVWAALGNDPDQPLFQAKEGAACMAESTNSRVCTTPDDETQCSDTGHALEAALNRCGLTVAEMQLRMLAADFCFPEEASGSLSKMLQVLGVRSITFVDIIDRHILPAFKSDQACQLPPDTLVSYLAFISLSGLLITSKFDAAPDTAQGKKLLKQLQQCAIICTNRGAMQVSTSEAIHLPVSLGNQFDICKHIPQHDFIMVSEHYAQSKALEPKSFRKLLFHLGATDCIQAPKQTISLSQASKPTSPWGLVNLGDAAEGVWVIKDHSAHEFEAVVQSVIAAEDQTQMLPSMQYLAELLSVHWAAHVGHWLSATCVNKSTGQTLTTHSSFGWALAKLAWLPSSSGTLSKGSNLYNWASREVTQFLQGHVMYLHANIKAADMLTWLGVKSTVTATSLLSVLKDWSQQDSFTTSLLHMTSIYERLSWEMASDVATASEVCAAFQSSPMIWLPSKESSSAAATAGGDKPLEEDEWQHRQSSRSKPVIGQFYGTADKLFVRDHTRVIESTSASAMRVLLKYYSTDTLHSFFLQQLCYPPSGYDQSAALPGVPGWGHQSDVPPSFQPLVPVYPSTSDYCELLASLASQAEASTASCEQALKVLLHWAALIGATPGASRMPLEDVGLLKTALYNRALLPTVKEEWVAASEGIYILDDDELAAAFREKAVHFLWLPEAMKPSATRGCLPAELGTLQPLLQTVGIPWLSLSVTHEALPSGSHFNTQVTHMLATSFPYLQRFFFWHRPTQYNRVAGRVLPLLPGFSCSETSDLYVMYTLTSPAGKPPVSSSIKRNALLQMAEDGLRCMLHVVEGDAGNLHDAFCELSKFFTPEAVDPDLLAFMQAFNATQLADQNIEDFMAKRGFHAMPEHEDTWAVPVSQVPAAYNLHARMQAAADRASEHVDDIAEFAKGGLDEEPSSPGSRQPRKPKQQVEVWPPAAPRFACAPANTSSASAPTDQPSDTTVKPIFIIYEDGSAPNHTSPSQAGAQATGSAARPHSATPASSAQSASIIADSSDGVSHHYPDGLATSDLAHSSDRQDRDRDHMQSSSLHQRAPRADEGSAQPPSAQSSVAGSGSKQACAAVDAAAGGDGFAEKRLEAYDAKHEAKHGQQPQKQQQQSPQSSSPSRAAGSNISPDKHIGVPFSLAAVDPVEAAAGMEELYLPDGVLHQVETALPEASTSMQSKETDLEVGRWGEELVYRFLLQHQRHSAQSWQVHWVNQAFNTGTPYDIRLRAPDGTEQFIEVKSSLAISKAFFEMSHQEVEMARRLGDQYSLYRVTGVATASPTLLRIVNPIRKWAVGQIKVCVVV